MIGRAPGTYHKRPVRSLEQQEFTPTLSDDTGQLPIKAPILYLLCEPPHITLGVIELTPEPARTGLPQDPRVTTGSHRGLAELYGAPRRRLVQVLLTCGQRNVAVRV